jgi:putative flippase GtrA
VLREYTAVVIVPASRSDGAANQVRLLWRHSAIRYLIAGGLSFIIDFGLLALLHVVFAWPVWIATATAFLVSFGFTYAIQRLFSFSAQVPHGRALLRYSVLVVINTAVSTAIVSALGGTILSWEGGKIVATALTTTWNYFAYRYWVFAISRGEARETLSSAESSDS